jgi:hypothetical protein
MPRYFRTRRQLGGYRIVVNAHTGLPISGFSGGLFHQSQTENWPGPHTAFRRLQSVAIRPRPRFGAASPLFLAVTGERGFISSSFL